jgi:hypothetical protein
MSWLFRNNWPWSLLAFLLGAIITWFLLARRQQPQVARVAARETAAEREGVLVGAGARTSRTAEAAPRPGPESRRDPAPAVPAEPEPPAQVEAKQVEPEYPVVPAEPEPPALQIEAKRVEPEQHVVPAEPESPAAQVEARRVEPEQPLVPAEREPHAVPGVHFSQRMDGGDPEVPTLFDAPVDDVPPGRFGEGSAEAVPHQGPPDGFTIKGNAQSMLFHTPESPYYGRTKPEVWFRTEADAERAGFTKYVRKPRKSPGTGK